MPIFLTADFLGGRWLAKDDDRALNLQGEGNLASAMRNDLLLYVGVGLFVGSAVLGLAVALAHVLKAKVEEFRYGVFYSVFALVASIGYCLASIAFYFNFLGPPFGIAIFCSLIALGFVAGLVVLAVRVRKNNRVLFIVLSFYSLFTVWLAPVFVWNLIYLIFIARRSRKEPDKPLQATAAAPGG